MNPLRRYLAAHPPQSRYPWNGESPEEQRAWLETHTHPPRVVPSRSNGGSNALDGKKKSQSSPGLALRARGWTLYGCHEDRSDPMTDYYSPASWHGVAEKDGCVVVDISAASSTLKCSGGYTTDRRVRGDDCPHCGGSGHEPDEWTFEQAKADTEGYRRWLLETDDVVMAPVIGSIVSPGDFKDGQYRCRTCSGIGHTWRTEEITAPWPTFQANPPRRNWHVERGGRILDSGVGLGPCADYDRQRAEAAIQAIVSRIESAMYTGAAPDSPAAAPATNASTIQRNQAHNGIEVRFAAKPAEEVRAGLKRLKFRWSRRQGLWYARYNASLWDRVHQLLDLDNVEPADPGTSEQNGLVRILLDEPETETMPAAVLHGIGVGLDWPVPLHARKELQRRGWQPLYDEDEAGKTEAWLCPEGQDYSQVIAQVYALDPSDEGPLVRVFTWPRPAAIAEPGPPSRIVIRRTEIEWSPDGYLQARDLDSGEIYVPHSPESNAPHQLALF